MSAVPPRVALRYSGYIQADHLMGYLKALKIIIAADHITPHEHQAFQAGMRVMGVSPEMRREIDEFDPRQGKLLEVLPNLQLGGRAARFLIRDAIELAYADGVYGSQERLAIHRVARLLGISSELLTAIESLVEIERAARHLKKSLMLISSH